MVPPFVDIMEDWIASRVSIAIVLPQATWWFQASLIGTWMRQKGSFTLKTSVIATWRKMYARTPPIRQTTYVVSSTALQLPAAYAPMRPKSAVMMNPCRATNRTDNFLLSLLSRSRMMMSRDATNAVVLQTKNA